jgi:hypothetical protein
VQRFLPAALVLGLLVATSAAFAVTEGLKLTPSPITRTQVPLRAFSPLCKCDRGVASLRFSLRTSDVLTLDVVTPGGREVRRLVTALPAHRRWNSFAWNGIAQSGRVAPNGTYQFKVHLSRARRTILLPNRIVLDTKPPLALSAEPNRPAFSPDGDRQADSVKIAYRLSEVGHAELYLGTRRLVYVRFAHREGSLTWNGRVDGRALPRGVYELRLGANDLAGNTTPSTRRLQVEVRIRYITLDRRSLTVRSGARFSVRVDTDAKSFAWKLGPRRALARGRTLVLHAPRTPGRYRLVVTEHGRSDAAPVTVTR